MLELKFTVDTSSGERELRVWAASLEDVNGILRDYGKKWLAHRVDERFQTRPGWPDRAKETVARANSAATQAREQDRSASQMRRKLQNELRRAKRNLGKVEHSEGIAREEARQQLLAASGKRYRSIPDVIKSRMAAIDRGYLVLREFERLAGGGSLSTSLTGNKAGAKRVAKLAERMGRSAAKSERPQLGKIPQTMRLEVKDGRLVYGSVVPWSDALNSGATVGHGAVIKPHPFAYLEDLDLDVLVAMLIGDDIAVSVS